MKRVGLIGGMGPESTLEYYNAIINSFKSEQGILDYPEMVIYSVNLSQFINLMKIKAYDEIVDMLSSRLESLKLAGAEFAAITANTPHILYDRLSERSPLPMISIVEATCTEAQRIGSKKPGLIGTGFTMASTYYQDVFSRHGMTVVVPDEGDQRIINYKLFSEIELGIFKTETRDLLISMMAKMARQQKIDSLILGCTEFPLILKDSHYEGIPMLNTTRIHVDAIVGEIRK